MGFLGALSSVVYNTLYHSALDHTETLGHTLGALEKSDRRDEEEKCDDIPKSVPMPSPL